MSSRVVRVRHVETVCRRSTPARTSRRKVPARRACKGRRRQRAPQGKAEAPRRRQPRRRSRAAPIGRQVSRRRTRPSASLERSQRRLVTFVRRTPRRALSQGPTRASTTSGPSVDHSPSKRERFAQALPTRHACGGGSGGRVGPKVQESSASCALSVASPDREPRQARAAPRGRCASGGRNTARGERGVPRLRTAQTLDA